MNMGFRLFASRISLAAFSLVVACAVCRGGTFTVTTTNTAGAGSLSNAIAQANLSAVSATNFIQFAIASLDSNTVQTITLPPASSGLPPLPPIIRRVMLDGYTQPGATSNTLAIGDNAKILIRIDGSVFNGGFYGPMLQLAAGSDGSTVRGLAIVEGVNNAQMMTISSQSNTVSGNFIGVDTDGATLACSGTAMQVALHANDNTIGGTSPAARNVIASSGGFALILSDADNLLVEGNYVGVNAAGTATLGSCSVGIDIEQGSGVTIGGGAPGAGNVVNAAGTGLHVSLVCACTLANAKIQGNLIGTDATGATALHTLAYGINLGSSLNATIGGGSPGEGNVISTQGDGIHMEGQPSGALIEGNKIGTDITGTIPLGNGSCGIEGPPGGGTGTIGGTNVGEGNIIAFSGQNGVSLATFGVSTWTILGNSIHDNAHLGITLGGCGTTTPTTNDACGTLTNAANHRQMFPVITSVAPNGGNVTLSGTLNGVSNTTYRLEFFSNPSCDPSGFGQGQVFLGFTNVTTDASCSGNFAATLVNPTGFADFTATATDTNGNTSEFSACASASGPCTIVCPTNMVVSTSPNQCGAIVFFSPTTSGNCGAVTCIPPSGSFFPKATNVVTCSTAGGSNCSFTIAVIDTVPPTIVCPANIVTNVPRSQTNAVVDYPAPVFNDNCGLVSEKSSPASGSVFPLGVTTVICTASDTSGNSNFSSFTVTVQHTNAPPVAQCRDVTTNADANCQAFVDVSAVDNGSFDSDGIITNRTLTPPGPYPKGTNAVTLTVVDDLGATNSCTASIIVVDSTPPTITCPADIVTNAPPGQSGVIVNYPPPLVTDNCSGVTTNSLPASGSFFPAGVTVVSCTAIDSSGHGITCFFTVTVNATPTNRFWINPLGGSYQTAANWLGNQVPLADDNANFITNTSYEILWSSDASAANAFFNATSGTVTQAVEPHVWTLTNSYIVGQNSGATSAVSHIGGTLFVTNSTGTATMVVGQNGTGTFNLDGGTVVADTLVVTNNPFSLLGHQGSTLNFDFGVLTTLHGSVITNRGEIDIGTVPGKTATWNVLGGSNAAVVVSFGSMLLGGISGRGALLVSGPTTVMSNNLQLVVGEFTSSNTCIVSNGAHVWAGSMFLGSGTNTSDNNVLDVTGSNSLLSVSFVFDIGQQGVSNRLVIDSGGSLSSAGATLGAITNANANSVLVAGPGSLWTDTGILNLGQGTGNSLTVSNGGQLHSVHAIMGGGGLGSSSNWALVTGVGSVWSNSDLTVGSNSATTTLIVSNGALVQASSLIIGSVAISGNLVAISGGTLVVTNPSGTGTLEVRNGTNLLTSGGVVNTDHLLVSGGFFQFNGGTLLTKTTTDNNIQPFLVGDGSSLATLSLVGSGFHSFNGLMVRSNGTLAGNGTVVGTLTLQNGGVLSPGLSGSVGKLAFTNSPVLQGITSMKISKNGSALTNDQAQVNSSITYGGTLVVSNLSSTALAAGDRFPLFSASSFAGAFTSINLPSLDAGLAWTNKLLADGSIQVISLPIPRFSAFLRSGATNLVFGGTGGPTNASYRVLTSTNVAVPLINWVTLLTNQFDANGNFTFTNSISLSVPTRFYRLSVP